MSLFNALFGSPKRKRKTNRRITKTQWNKKVKPILNKTRKTSYSKGYNDALNRPRPVVIRSSPQLPMSPFMRP